MSLIADITLFISALGAAFYCRVLAIRLKRLGQTDQGLGGAISTLNFQVDEMKSALEAVSASADARALTLEKLNSQADATCRRLELLMATLHDHDDVRQPSSGAVFRHFAAPADLNKIPRFPIPSPIKLRATRQNGAKETTK